MALSGEVCVDYALRLKRELGPERTWVAGYANQVPCYIPSDRVLAEGGYEAGWGSRLGRAVASGSLMIYGWPVPFARDWKTESSRRLGAWPKLRDLEEMSEFSPTACPRSRPPGDCRTSRGSPSAPGEEAAPEHPAMKKLINAPGAVVPEMLAGLTVAYPNLRKLPGQNVLARADIDPNRHDRVALISGGGSGHEPAHAGYVGRGMLSAAVAGDVFTSPPPDAVLAAIRAVTGPRGCLLIVKNYTGDRLNFGLAAERARAEGLAVEMVLVADDVALADATGHAGRRGLAGTILVHKVAGAAAEAGLSLAEVAAEARAVAAEVRTMGVALAPCTVPAAGEPGFSLGEGEIEMGLGIHGEPGLARVPLAPADTLVDAILGRLVPPREHSAGRPVALMVNGLGGTPAMELAIVARRAVETLEGWGLAVERVYLGNFLTALEMAGVSLTLLPVAPERIGRLDSPTSAPAWSAAPGRPRERVAEPPAPVETGAPLRPSAPATEAGRALARRCLGSPRRSWRPSRR